MRSNSQRRLRRPAVMQRIAGLERALEEAQHLLHQDDLTPHLNRRGFRRACDRWAGGLMAMSACCVMIDLDGFKTINDRHGHPVGDAALLHFADPLHRHMRPADGTRPVACANGSCAPADSFLRTSGDVSLDYALEHMRRSAPGFGPAADTFLKRIRG